MIQSLSEHQDKGDISNFEPAQIMVCCFLHIEW